MLEKNKNVIKIDEFELVNNAESQKNAVFKEENIRIEPVMNKTNTGIEYNIYDSQKNLIGKVNENKKVTLDSKYKNRKQAENANFDFYSDKIEADVKAMVERQRQRDEQLLKNKQLEENNKITENDMEERNQEERKAKINQPKQELNKKQNEKVAQGKNKKEDDKLKSVSYPITDKELREQGYDVSAWTRIKDQSLIESMIPGEVDPRCVVVAEIDNNKYKFLGKKLGEDKIVELPEKAGGNNSAEEVNKFEGNVEKSQGRGVTMVMPDYGNQEFSIKKTQTGEIEVGRIANIDGKGKREVIPVQTDRTHPTIEERNRAEYEKYGYEFDDAIMTGEEIEARVADEVESIRDEVMEYVNSTAENPTKQQLEEKITEARENYENEKEKEDEEKENNNKETEEEDWLYGMSSRRRNRI